MKSASRGIESHPLLAPVSTLLQGRAGAVLLDFPAYDNVGDSAIWLGERELFARLGLPVVKTCNADIHSLPSRLFHIEQPTIFLQGGGNFGDLWLHHQAFREAVVQRFPQHRIVQLPQSLFFVDAGRMRQAAQVFASHPDFHLLVRDTASLELARAMGLPNVVLAPDAASLLQVKAWRSSAPPDHDVLVLSRQDQEKREPPAALNAALAASAPLRVLLADWADPPGLRLHHWYKRVAEVDLAKRPHWAGVIDRVTVSLAHRLAEARLRNGLALLGRAPVIVTDRLHVVILGSLLGKTVWYSDNSYRKVGGYVDVWLKQNRQLVPVGSLSEGLERAVAAHRASTSPGLQP